MQILNQPITWHHINTSRHGQDNLLKFKLSMRMGKKGDFSDFEHVVWCQTSWSELFRNSWSNGIFTHNHL